MKISGQARVTFLLTGPHRLAPDAVVLQDTDILDPSKRSMFKYVKMDVQNLQDMLNSEKLDEPTLVKDINIILSHWTGLFSDGESVKLAGGLKLFMDALEKLMGLLGMCGTTITSAAKEYAKELSQKATVIQKATPSALKKLDRLDSTWKKRREALIGTIEKHTENIQNFQVLVAAEKCRAEKSAELGETNEFLDLSLFGAQKCHQFDVPGGATDRPLCSWSR